MTINNSTFTIAGQGDGYGYSGGALCFENGTSKVEKSTFTCTGSKLFHAGGFIDIVGSGTHTIEGNTMTGRGKDNGQQIASFGGAISVEQGANAIVTIKDNTIKDTSASDNGGAIAIGTKKGVATPSTVTMSGNKITNTGTLFWGGQAGGGVFVGPEATVTMSGDIISGARAGFGGGIYNEGNLTLTGVKGDAENAIPDKPTIIKNNLGYSLGGGVVNDGYLKVDYATFSGNTKGDWSTGNGHIYNKNEMAGENIYALRDIIITPEATFDGKDIRIIEKNAHKEESEKTSKIILTGPLTNQLNVSISETPKTGGNEKFNESQKRRVGYLVAEGTGGYNPTKEDAQKIHYLSKDTDPSQPRADFSDHESTGKWDFVLNPETNQVVLGQRAKVILDPNGTEEAPANHDGMNAEENKEQNFVIYSTTAQIPTLEKSPIREGYTFTGWYKEPKVNDDAEDGNKEGKTLVKTLNDIRGNKDEITTILNPNEYTLYAGWKKENADKYKVKYKFEPEDKTKTLPEEVTELTPTDPKEYGSNTEVTPVTLDTTEVKVSDGTWKFDNKWEPEKQTITDKDVEFVGTWKFEKKVNPETKYEVKYKFEPEDKTKTLPEEVTELTPTDPKEYGSNTEVTPVTLDTTEVKVSDGTWKFDNKWEPEKQTITDKDVEFVGTWKFEKKVNPETKYEVKYKFEPEDKTKTLPEKVTNLLPKDENQYKNGDSITPKTLDTREVKVTGGTWTFKGWDEDSKTIDGANVEFIGKWEFKSDDSGQTPDPENPNPDPGKTDPENPRQDKIITRYVDEFGNDLILRKDGDHPKEIIPGYEFIKTERSENLVSHIYRKIERDENNIKVSTKIGIDRSKLKEPERPVLNKEDHKAYMFGYPDWTFRPDNNMTRAEATCMFARLLKNYPREDVRYNLSYPDIKEDEWYYPAIGFMTENNIIEGYEDGSFRPNNPITRAEFSKMASKFDDLVGNNTKAFADVSENHWALKYINSAYAKGWVNGYEDGSFRPDRNITRAEVVTITNKMLNRYADQDFVRANKSILIDFKDLEEAYWAYFNIMEATHGHDFVRKPNGMDELWERLNGEAFIFPKLRYNVK